MSPLRRQGLGTLLLLPLMFGLWAMAGGLFAAPAVWLLDALLALWLPGLIDSVALSNTQLQVASAWGVRDGQVVSAAAAGNQLLFELDTRLLSYSVPFYAALRGAQPDDRLVLHLCIGMTLLWLLMALGFIAMLSRDLMINVGEPFLALPQVPPAAVIALAYQFSVLIGPTLLPVVIWVAQLRGSPLWSSLSSGVREAVADDPRS